MVEIGSLEIGGSINTADIDSGLKRVDKGLAEVARTGKSVNSDFERMNNATSSLVKKMGLLSLVGGGALLALAKGAPAVAPAMAMIAVNAGKLSRTLGEILAPAFEVVSEGFGKFVAWIQKYQDMKIPVLDVTIGEGLATVLKEFGGPAVLAMIGGKFGGPVGALAGAGVGLVAQEMGDVQGGGSATIGALTGATIGTAIAPGLGTAIGFGVGALAGKLFDMITGTNERMVEKGTWMAYDDGI